MFGLLFNFQVKSCDRAEIVSKILGKLRLEDRGGTVVKYLSQDQEVVGSRLTRGTALCL